MGNTDLVALVNGTCSECRQLGLSDACSRLYAQPRRPATAILPRILRWGLAKFAKAVSAQRFRRSLTDLAAEKVSFFDAAILIFSPFAGLRPSRSGVALTLNFPKPDDEFGCVHCRGS